MRSRSVSLLLILALFSIRCASTTNSHPHATPDVVTPAAAIDDGCTPHCAKSPCWAICPPETPPDCNPCAEVCPKQRYVYSTPCCTDNINCPKSSLPSAPRGCNPGPTVTCTNGTTTALRPLPSCTSSDPTPCGLGPPTDGVTQFAVIGDWGNNQCGQCAAAVSNLLKGFNDQWPLDFVLTTGDNFYPLGSQQDLKANMPLYSWLCPDQVNCPQPQPGEPAKFLPVLGNHDVYTESGRHYFDYFTALSTYAPSTPPSTNNAPWTPRYYAYTVPGGLIDIFSLDANNWEPDGIGPTCPQARWLQGALKASKAQWKIVAFHEPPYSTYYPGTEPHMQWPFKDWGATLVITGHIHAYERMVDLDSGYTVVVNGLGGTDGHDPITDPCYPPLKTPLVSEVRYAGSVGAMVGTATSTTLRFCMMVLDSQSPNGYACIDNFSFTK